MLWSVWKLRVSSMFRLLFSDELATRLVLCGGDLVMGPAMACSPSLGWSMEICVLQLHETFAFDLPRGLSVSLCS